MKKILFLLFSGLLIFSQLYGQGIRKHYLELTDAERIQYKIALDNVHNSGIRENFADIHFDPDQDGLTGNTPTSPPDMNSPIHLVEDFLPWHRQFVLQYEYATIIYDAANFIDLNELFTVKNGSDFSVVIDGCGGTVINSKTSAISPK